MGDIQIGTRISERRKAIGITQEELANHLGVSKPAVSKWESGQSYPDILLLPELAAYFNISIDELVGYEPQMTKEEVRKLYRRLADAFTREPFDRVHAECGTYLKKYYSCYELQFQMGLLLLNHMSLAGHPEKTTEVTAQVLEIFKRVGRSSEDVHLAKQSVHLQALCCLSLEQPDEALRLLENMKEPAMNTDSLLVKAYQMKGDMDKALEYLQGYVYVNLMNILGAIPDFFRMYTGNSEKIERFYQISCGLKQLFEIDELHPAILMQVELMAAFSFAGQGDMDKALHSLEKCTELMGRIGKGKLILKGNAIFDVLERYFVDIDIEVTAPRNKEAIWHDLKKLIINNPAFDGLKDEERYQRIIRKLENE